jgi:holliday junction DNA helicase RuvA
MIGKLTGVVDYISSEHLIVDVGGVGYLVLCPAYLYNSYEVGSKISLWIHAQIKEEQMFLFGFASLADKEWFLRLQEVQGVGAKMSLQILGAMAINDIINAILSEDVSVFKQISGVGPKLASRLVNELKNNKHVTNASLLGNSSGGVNDDNRIIMDAVSVLSNLGFSRKDAFVTVSNIKAENSNITLEEIIKNSLSALSNSK